MNAIVIILLIIITFIVLITQVSVNKSLLEELDVNKETWWKCDILPGFYGHYMSTQPIGNNKVKALFYQCTGDKAIPQRPITFYDTYFPPLDPAVMIFNVKKNNDGTYVFVAEEDVQKIQYLNTVIDQNWKYDSESKTLSNKWTSVYTQKWTVCDKPTEYLNNKTDYSNPVEAFRWFVKALLYTSSDGNYPDPTTGSLVQVGRFDPKVMLDESEQMIRDGTINAQSSYEDFVKACLKMYYHVTGIHTEFNFISNSTYTTTVNDPNVIFTGNPIDNWLDIPTDNAQFFRVSAGDMKRDTLSQAIYKGLAYSYTGVRGGPIVNGTEFNIVVDNYLQNPKRLAWSLDSNGKFIFTPDDYNNPTSTKFVSGNINIPFPAAWSNEAGDLYNPIGPTSRNNAAQLFFGVIPGGGKLPFGFTDTPYGIHGNIHGDVGYVQLGTMWFHAFDGQVEVQDFRGGPRATIDDDIADACSNILLAIWDYFRSINIDKIIIDVSSNLGGVTDSNIILGRTLGGNRCASSPAVLNSEPDMTAFFGPSFTQLKAYVKPSEYSNRTLRNARLTYLMSGYTNSSAEQFGLSLMGDNDDGNIGNNVKVIHTGENSHGDTGGTQVTLSTPFEYGKYDGIGINPAIPFAVHYPLWGLSVNQDQHRTPKGRGINGSGIPVAISLNQPTFDWGTGTFWQTVASTFGPDIGIPNMTIDQLCSGPDLWMTLNPLPVEQWKFSFLDQILQSNQFFIE